MVNCSCIKGVFDFQILGYDKENIIFQDLSEWMEGDHYLLPDEYSITIESPLKSKATVLVSTANSTRIQQKDTNFFFFDGVYTFSVESCGKVYTKKVGLFPEFECCLDVAFIKLPDLVDTLLKMQIDLQAVKSSILLGDSTTSKEAFMVLKRKLANLECDCSLHCKK